MGSHRLSSIIERLLEQEAPLFDFFTGSAWALGDPEDPEVCDLVVGNPHEMALPAFVEAIQRWVPPQDDAWFAYKFNEPYAREAVATGLRRRRGVPFEPEDVFLTDGAFTGLNLCVRVVADPGDEIVFLSPPWFFYSALIVAQGATPVRALVDRRTWDPDLDALEAAITERTRAVIVNSPNNPTGRIYPPEVLGGLAQVLSVASERIGRPIYLISDEAYSRIVFDDRAYPSPTEHYASSFLVYTYGKQLLAPGQRLGYVALPPTMPDREPVRAAFELAQMSIGGNGVPNAVMQRALADLDELSVDVKALQRRRDLLTEALRASGYELPTAEGTFYLLPTSPIPDDRAFVERLARDKVYVLPGSLVETPGRFRISITGNDDMVERSIPVFERAAREA